MATRDTALVLTIVLAGCKPPSLFDIYNVSEPRPGESSSDGSGSSGSTGDGESSSTSDGSGGGSGTSDSTTTGSTGASSADTDHGSTTEDPPEEFPLCGNGELDGAEECDDASPLCDGCKRARFVFVTSFGRKPDGIGGLKGADSLCKQAAGKAGLNNWQSYTAWLSDSTTNAKDRIYPGRGRYLRVDMVEVAASWEQLFSGQLLAPIGIDENGQHVNAAVWTGTLPDGTAAPGVDHCDDWTVFDNSKRQGYTGGTITADAWWTLYFFPDPDPEINPDYCADLNHLYCFEGK